MSLKFYKCSCCGKMMDELVPNTVDASNEKHVPVINVDGNKVEVVVGSVEHPMLEEHFITNIILETSKEIKRVKLNPNSEPKAVFYLSDDEVVIAAYEYCNLHGLWKKEYNK